MCVFVQWGYAVGWLCGSPAGNLAADVSTLLWAGGCSQPAANTVREDEGGERRGDKGRSEGMGGSRLSVHTCRVPDEEQRLKVICHHLARLEELLVAGTVKCCVLRLQHPMWVR